MPNPLASCVVSALSAATALLAVALAAPEAAAQSPTWQQRAVNSPPARNSSPAAYDVYRGVTTLFGGYNGTTTALGDTWEWNGTLWAPRLTALRPAPRWGHSMAFDSKRGRVVLFGGYDGSVWRNDTWEWDGFAWTQRSLPSAPTARGYFGMTYDAARGVVVVFGGAGNLAIFGDTWEYDGFGWTQRSPASAPSPRRGVAMAWDETRRETLLFGGGDGTTVGNDLWAWNGVTWSQKAVTAAPPARWEGYFAFDGNCGRALLYGGADLTFANNLSDSWAWDGLQWTQLSGAQPPARHGAAQVHDAQRGQFVLWGGRDAAGFRSDTWELGPSCSRAMSVVAAPVVGQTAQFRYDYPPAAGALHFCWTLVTPRQPAAFAVPIPGFPTIGLCRVDLFNILLDPRGFLDGSGELQTTVPIPASNVFVGFEFDVQSVDLDFYTLALRWADSDAEVVTAAALPGSSFSVAPAAGAAPLTVSFSNNSTLATSYFWDFGDGTSSTAADPSPKVFVGGTYTVSLTATGPGGSAMAQQQVVVTGASAAPVASFTATPTSGNAPLVVQISDTSTQFPTSWQWDFNNDGVVDSTAQNPTWTYTDNGIYSVKLTATNFLGDGTRTRANYVFVGFSAPNPLLNMQQVVPATFVMGSVLGAQNEQPIHSVTLARTFWIGKYEVTQAEYQAIMGSNPSQFQGPAYPDAAQRPVDSVSWNQAQAYCQQLTLIEYVGGRLPQGYQYRLPTEAEWEFCCRAGTTTEWSFGSALTTTDANFAGSLGQTAIVGSYPSNPLGIHDMHGNVWEWCLDSYGVYASTPSVDPFVTGGQYRLLRGGSWVSHSTQYICRSAYRNFASPNVVNGNFGFRVVLAPYLVP